MLLQTIRMVCFPRAYESSVRKIMNGVSRIGCVATISVVMLMVLSPAHGRGLSRISGKIYDHAESTVVGALVIFESTAEHQSTRTLEDGTYSIDLSPGVYEVRVPRNGFYRMRRSPLLVKNHSLTGIDFQLVVEISDTDALQYSEEELNIANLPIRALLQFGKRSEHGVVEYKGISEQGSYIRPVFTYDHWTLRADTLTYDPGTMTLSGAGSVIWQDGKTTKNVRHLRISLGNPPRIPKIEP